MSHRPAALVTGGAVRLGRALCLGLADAGYDIAVHYGRSAEAADALVATLRARGREAVALQHDLRDVGGLDPLVARAHAALPGLDVLVNSAATYSAEPFTALDPDAWDTHHAVNLRAPCFLMKAFAAHVGRGAIVNIVDNKVAYQQPAWAAYLLTKKALADATRMAAVELAPAIRVNGVSPGVVLPAGTRSADYVAWRTAGIPLHRTGDPADVVRAVRYLLDSPFVTGQILTVDGGEGVAHVGRHAGNYPGGSADGEG